LSPRPAPPAPVGSTGDEVTAHARAHRLSSDARPWSPSRRWSDIQANPNSSWYLNGMCKVMTPRQLVDAAIFGEFRDKPIARVHLDHYLLGRRSDIVENAKIDLMLRQDAGVKAMIAARIPPGRRTGTAAFSFKVEQSDYQNQDLRFAFGAIDQLDVEVDFDAGTVHAWFQDYYEWHPYYPGLYTAWPDDGPRETNCLHAALVELKDAGAADFCMKGEATVPLGVVAPGGRGGGGSAW
jgi:hypothetical protein